MIKPVSESDRTTFISENSGSSTGQKVFQEVEREGGNGSQGMRGDKQMLFGPEIMASQVSVIGGVVIRPVSDGSSVSLDRMQFDHAGAGHRAFGTEWSGEHGHGLL